MSEREAILAAAAPRSRALVDHPAPRWTTHRGVVRDLDAYVAGTTAAKVTP